MEDNVFLFLPQVNEVLHRFRSEPLNNSYYTLEPTNVNLKRLETKRFILLPLSLESLDTLPIFSKFPTSIQGHALISYFTRRTDLVTPVDIYEIKNRIGVVLYV